MKKLFLLALMGAMFATLLAPAALAQDGTEPAGAELAQAYDDDDDGTIDNDGSTASATASPDAEAEPLPETGGASLLALAAGASLLGTGLLGLRVLRRDP